MSESELPPRNDDRESGLLGCTFVAIPVLAMYFLVLPAMMSSDDYALERLAKCEEAVELLGEPVGRGWWPGMGHFESAGEGMTRASWRLPVKGSRASGTLSFNHTRTGGTHTFSGSLTVDDTTVDVGLCRTEGEVHPTCQEAHDLCLVSPNEEAREHCGNLLTAGGEFCEQVLPAYQLAAPQETK